MFSDAEIILDLSNASFGYIHTPLFSPQKTRTEKDTVSIDTYAIYFYKNINSKCARDTSSVVFQAPSKTPTSVQNLPDLL